MTQHPVTYPELIINGPMGRILGLLRKGVDPVDAHSMAERVTILGTMSGRADRTAIDTYLYWALHRWDRAGCPVFTLDGELAWSVAHTEPAMTTFDLLPQIPVDGMYVSMPPVFDIGDDDIGRHRIEGLFLTVNDIYVPVDGRAADGPVTMVSESERQDYRVVRGITVVGVGEDKAPNLADRLERGDGWDRNDWIVFFNLVPGMPLYIEGGPQGIAELTRVTANLLFLLQNTTEIREEPEPTRPEFVGDDRKARRERDRQHRKGRSAIPHRVWHLSEHDRGKVLPDPDAPTVDNPGRTVSGHVVLGHIHRYWVLDPAGRRSLGTRTVETRTGGRRTYHLVAKWLQPYVRGEGPVAAPRVLVR
ncbi:MAG: hypothetical protein EBT79_07500 [Actinobacteria bacterium]|nr:hypothetical protein [Actinomycetota bacterium]